MNTVLVWKLLLSVTIFLILLLLSTFLFYKIYFQRDPERQILEGNYVLAPADGTVQKIIKFDLNKTNAGIKIINKKYLGKIKTDVKDVSNKGYLVSIFMSPLDVHVNRAPINGKIINQSHKNGTFHPAFKFWETLENEKNEILIEGNYTIKNSSKTVKIKTIQIAGAVARRIESFVKKNDLVKAGEKIGRINLGSQTTLILPDSIKIVVKEGDKVFAGESKIGIID